MRCTRIVCAAAVAMAAGSVSAQVATQWNFDGDLGAAFGPGILDYFTPETAGLVTFGTAATLAAPTPDGGNPNVMAIDFFDNSSYAFVCLHQAPPNGGGIYVNDYTIIVDLYVPQSSFDSFGWLSLYNTNCCNSNDGDMFVDLGGNVLGVGELGGYSGDIQPDRWYRIAWTFQVQPDNTVKFRKYVDGTLIGVADIAGIEGRFALYSVNDANNPWFTFLSDESGDMAPCVVASMYFADFAWSGEQIKALGCVSAGGATTPGPVCSDQPPFCDSPADMNNDGVLNVFDFLAFQTEFGNGCP